MLLSGTFVLVEFATVINRGNILDLDITRDLTDSIANAHVAASASSVRDFPRPFELYANKIPSRIEKLNFCLAEGTEVVEEHEQRLADSSFSQLCYGIICPHHSTSPALMVFPAVYAPKVKLVTPPAGNYRMPRLREIVQAE